MKDQPRREADDRLADWVDDRLSPRERERFVAELRVNAQLRQDLEDYERTVGVLRAALRAPTGPSPMTDRIMAAVKSQATAPIQRRAISWHRAWWSLASAAALLVCALWIDAWSGEPNSVTIATLDADGRAAAAPEVAAGNSELRKADDEPRGLGGVAKQLQPTGQQPTVEQSPGNQPEDLQEAAVPKPIAGFATNESQNPVSAPLVPPPGVEVAEGTKSKDAAPTDRGVGRAVGGGGPTGRAPTQPGAPGGPATGAPAGPSAPAPAVAPAAVLDAEKLGATGESVREKAKNDDLPRTDLPRTGSDDFYLGQARRQVTRPVLAMVEVDGFVEATPAATDQKAVGERSRAVVPPKGKDEVPGEKRSTGLPAAGAADADKKTAELVLDAAGLVAGLDAFLASAAVVDGDAKAEMWTTPQGPLRASPVVDREIFQLLTDDAKNSASLRKELAAVALAERTWLVEGRRADVQTLLARLAAFARDRQWTLRNGETLAPAEPPVAPPTSPVGVDAGAAATDSLRVVLRIRLRPR